MASPKPALKSSDHCSNVVRLADHCGIPRRTFSDWTKAKDFPAKSAKGWLVSEVVAYAESKQKPDNPEWEFERARKMRADASKAELALAQQKGELIPAGEVERVWSQKNAELCAMVGKAHARIAPKLSGLDAPAILKALNEMWRKIREESAHGNS